MDKDNIQNEQELDEMMKIMNEEAIDEMFGKIINSSYTLIAKGCSCSKPWDYC